MSQYKMSMARMYGIKSDISFAKNVTNIDIKSGNSSHDYSVYHDMPSFFAMMKTNDKFILSVLAPVVWCFGIVLIMDKTSFLETLYMPFLGIFAAFIANCVPLGGGIVYIPAFYLLGVQMKLGVAFTVATMTIGNGLFGLLRWLRKNPSFIIWESFQYTVLPSSIGTIIAVYCLPSPSVQVVRKSFALFCVLLGMFVAAAAYKGGLAKIVASDPLHDDVASKSNNSSDGSGSKSQSQESSRNIDYTKQVTETADVVDDSKEVSWSPVVSANNNTNTDIFENEESAHLITSDGASNVPELSAYEWGKIVIVSFLAGLVLVPNIGMGPALTTFLMLAMAGYKPERAIVTGIVTGGWASIVPFIIHLFYYDDVPYKLWLMVLPGVFFGAKYAPYVHDFFGMNNVMMTFAVFLFATAILFASH